MYSMNPLPSMDSQPQIENTVLYPWLVKSEDANYGDIEDWLYIYWKKSAYEYTYSVRTHVVQGTDKLYLEASWESGYASM